jgi:hypothetical protein
MIKVFFPGYIFGVYNDIMGEPIGMLAIDMEGVIRGALIDKDYRGKENGHTWLPEILEKMKEHCTNKKLPFDKVRARIHKDNPMPAKVVSDCGFVMVSMDNENTFWEYKLE